VDLYDHTIWRNAHVKGGSMTHNDTKEDPQNYICTNCRTGITDNLDEAQERVNKYGTLQCDRCMSNPNKRAWTLEQLQERNREMYFMEGKHNVAYECIKMFLKALLIEESRDMLSDTKEEQKCFCQCHL
jgi:hypothetical protein